MKLLFLLSILLLIGGSSTFYIDFPDHVTPQKKSYNESVNASSSDAHGFALSTFSRPKWLSDATYLLNIMVWNVTFSLATEGIFIIPFPEKPLIVDKRPYYWHPSLHPPLETGTIGCRMPMTTLVDASEFVSPFTFRFPKTRINSKMAMNRFLASLRFEKLAEPPELAWYCRGANLTCCGLGCCHIDRNVQNPPTIGHEIFVYSCLAFLAICILTLFVFMFAFVFKDFLHRYFFWFPATPRSPRPELRSRQLTPTPTPAASPVLQRSPSRCHLTVS